MTANTLPATNITTWEIDPTHSFAEFGVKHMMVATAKGRINNIAGVIRLNEVNPAASSVEATADMASIDTSNTQRDQHLRTDDFFNIEQFPTASFRSTSIEVVDRDRAKVHGDLTLRGVTKDVVFDVELEGRGTDAYGKQRVGFNAEATINRLDFGVKWNPAIETGGFVVSDRVKLTINVSAVRSS